MRTSFCAATPTLILVGKRTLFYSLARFTAFYTSLLKNHFQNFMATDSLNGLVSLNAHRDIPVTEKDVQEEFMEPPHHFCYVRKNKFWFLIRHQIILIFLVSGGGGGWGRGVKFSTKKLVYSDSQNVRKTGKFFIFHVITHHLTSQKWWGQGRVTFIHFRAEFCQKYAHCQKFLQVKIVKDSIWYKKVSGRICLSLPSLWRGARELQRLSFSKYEIVRKRQSRFTLGLNTAKKMHYIKKCFK